MSILSSSPLRVICDVSPEPAPQSPAIEMRMAMSTSSSLQLNHQTTKSTLEMILTHTTTAATSALRVASARAFGAAVQRSKHTLPDLPYGYDVRLPGGSSVSYNVLTLRTQALEPSISKEIMTLHHTKHHQTYVTGLNAAEESLGKFQSASDIKSIIGLQAALKFNGGGHINHSLFWKNLAPYQSEATKLPAGSKLEELVQREFGGLEGLKKAMNAKTAAVQGSGWGWLVSVGSRIVSVCKLMRRRC